MGSLAQLARAAGHRVTGADVSVYPPMSTQLQLAGIELIEGFSRDQLKLSPDLFVIGNVVSRGNPLMEAILDAGCPYISGPQWLSDNILQGRWTLAVSGTHGKTTTATMLAWILEYAGMSPGYLIGGVPGNFPCSARLGECDFFVIEADEYDTAFFDKRSKFVHYRPNTLVVNNLEFDHADIFADLAAIQTQFHHLVRTVPGNGLIIYPRNLPAVEQVLDKGCWSERQTFGGDGADWQVLSASADGACFELKGPDPNQASGRIQWHLTGRHNVQNAVAAVAAARHVGVLPELACEALCAFKGVKRRMELLAEIGAIRVYDDFAHHPTAIQSTLEGLRANVGSENILAIIEPRSNTMKQGVHRHLLAEAVACADHCLWFQPSAMDWSLQEALKATHTSKVFSATDDIICSVAAAVTDYTKPLHIVVMSNGGFAGVHQELISVLRERHIN